MTLHNLSKEHLEIIINSVKTNPNLKSDLIEEILNPIRVQYKEQLEGAAWKSNIRTNEHVS